MKHIITNIDSYSAKANCASFKARGGALLVWLYKGGVVKVRYDFDGVMVPQDMIDAESFICSGLQDIVGPDVEVSDLGDSYSISLAGDADAVSVLVRKADAIVKVFRDGVLVHDGSLGDNDTTLPSYTVRCITDGSKADGSPNVRAIWNFPADKDDEFYGLGDKSGKPDRRGQSCHMFNRDALGYDASYSDPLYKSVPFVLRHNNRTGVDVGLLFPQTAIDEVDFARESHYYMSLRTSGGPFSFLLFTGDDYAAVLEGYYSVTGKSIFPPLFSFGFFGSSMNYVEPDDAADRVLDYFERIGKEELPCEGLYMSSGYLKHGAKRYTFLINRSKFPDPHAYFTALRDRGYNVTMNIKPGVLVTHPWYDELKQKGCFIKDSDGNTVTEYYWGGDASFVDFDNPQAASWWKDQLRTVFLENGCTGIWNDNNELELEDSQIPAYRTRALYPVKMARAAYEAFKETWPDMRPWNYSRSGYAGLQRYARTWSGDNTSTWRTLRYNQYQGIGLGLSGLPFFGHDIGGFAGDVPEEELLVRSCQSAVFQSRFVIHSWRASGNPTEPWTYPDSTSVIESLIREHYRFLPYIYSTAYQNIMTGRPVERSLHLEFPADREIASDCPDCLFGDNVLKVNVVEKGVTERAVHFPASCSWIDPLSNEVHPGGSDACVDVSICGRANWFAREGSVIATCNEAVHNTGTLLEDVTLLVFPAAGDSVHESVFFADDGSSELRLGRYSDLRFTVGKDCICVKKEKLGYDGVHKVTFVLPEGFVFGVNSSCTVEFGSLEAIAETLPFRGSYGKCDNP